MTPEEFELRRNYLQGLQWEAWRRDPLLWAEERLGEPRTNFMWSELEGYLDHQWDGDENPIAQAWMQLGKSYGQVKDGNLPEFRYVGIESATGCSKTFWLARLMAWYLDCWDNSLVVTTAPKESQLKLGLWSEVGMLYNKLRKARPDSSLYKLRLAMDESSGEDLAPDEIETSDSWHGVGFVAGTSADEESATRARGFHRRNMLIILEECTGIPPSIMTAFQNTSTGLTNFIVAVGNPDNEHDPLHQFCLQKDVKSFRISALDYPNIVKNQEIFPGGVTHASIQSRTDNYGKGSPLWNAMVRGISPTQSNDSLIKLEWIEQCIDLEVPFDKQGGYNAVGVDVANSNTGDKAALCWGQGHIMLELHEFQCPNATHLAYNLIYDDEGLISQGYKNYHTRTLDYYSIGYGCIGVDSVGVGVATVNAFEDKGYGVQSLHGGLWEEAIPLDPQTEKPLYRFASLRAQMYWELREDLRKGHISIQVADKTTLNRLKKELCVPKFKANNAYIAVESKDDIKKRMGGKSPNLADGAAYWNWVRKGYRINMFNSGAIGS